MKLLEANQPNGEWVSDFLHRIAYIFYRVAVMNIIALYIYL